MKAPALLLFLALTAGAALAGHDLIEVDPALKRHAGQVTALGEPDGSPLDLTMLETVLPRRSGDAFRIVHCHGSTDDPAFQERARKQRSQKPAR